MAIDSSLAIRQGMILLLAGTTDVTDLVPAVRVYPQATKALPDYPFIRMGAPSNVPIRSSCVDGSTTIIAVHAFAQELLDGSGARLETAEDRAHKIGAAIASALDTHRLTLANGNARIRWTGAQLLQDPQEAGVFHSVNNFEVRAITA